MTSTAKNIINTPDQVISSFDALITALRDDPEYQSYKLAEVSIGVASIYKDGLTKFFLSADIWSNKEVRAKYAAHVTTPGIMVLCVGDAAELQQNTDFLMDRNVHAICLPSAKSYLSVSLHSLHKLQSLVDEAHTERLLVENASNEVKYVLSISRELNGERDIKKLLNLILLKAREITKADAGSIYTVEVPGKNIREGKLHFRFTQNHSVMQNLNDFTMQINEKSIVGNAVIQGVSINIPDLYKLDEDPTKNAYGARHDRSWDKRIGYESHSMLTVPMYDISHSVVGVIQLINRKRDSRVKLHEAADFQAQVTEFGETDVEYAEIVAQQAGIALENANMHDEIQRLFDGFVKASVTAIEQRDPTTSGHSTRVAALTTSLAEAVHRISDGEFREVFFNEDEMKEIRYASLLHDFGKLGVSENVLVKAKKLYPWQYDLVEERFKLIRSSYEIEYLRNCVNILQNPNAFPMGVSVDGFETERDKKNQELDFFFDFIKKANEPTVLEQGGFELLKDIANFKFSDLQDADRPFVLASELKALSVSRGSLTAEEFAQIQSHVTHTFEFLRKIPWGTRLSNIPQIAFKHHEKLDGSGYPSSAASIEIPIQSRMMTIADIYDALTASDRPYKKAIPPERALDIIGMEVRGGKVDSGLYDVFVEAKIYDRVRPDLGK
jgi:HD-GYP domain-containing protein (c-di-GMP phosphodiesterase class II)